MKKPVSLSSIPQPRQAEERGLSWPHKSDRGNHPPKLRIGQWEVVRSLDDGTVELLHPRGNRRRVTLCRCVECQEVKPDFEFGSGVSMLPGVQITPLIQKSCFCQTCEDAMREQRRAESRMAGHARRVIWQKERARDAAARRAAAIVAATPVWADRQAIAAVYHEMRRKTVETGIQHHVDHIHPIQGVTLCGLHVHWNLRVITATENISKSNRLVDVA